MEKIEVSSPAKINIGLNVLRKRNDGFHDISTIFHPLQLKDFIEFEKSDNLEFYSNNSLIKGDDSNLIIKSIAIVEKTVNRKLSVRIKLEKDIPIGAGLGGGSSNAASTLKALNSLFNLNLSYNLLSDLALQLGSDVPYFLNPVTCFAESRGEKLFLLKFSISYPILIINPGIHVETKWAFSLINPDDNSTKLNSFLKTNKFDIENLKNIVTNDFERIVFESYPEIAEIKLKLYSSGAEFALMSGTGSTVYGIFTNLQKARIAQSEFDKKYFTFLNYSVEKGSIT
jgi:4-diphosphocytidyl-2-C-methyl-D-erythritol kinase